MYTFINKYVYIYISIERKRERERERQPIKFKVCSIY